MLHYCFGTPPKLIPKTYGIHFGSMDPLRVKYSYRNKIHTRDAMIQAHSGALVAKWSLKLPMLQTKLDSRVPYLPSTTATSKVFDRFILEVRVKFTFHKIIDLIWKNIETWMWHIINFQITSGSA